MVSINCLNGFKPYFSLNQLTCTAYVLLRTYQLDTLTPLAQSLFPGNMTSNGKND